MVTSSYQGAGQLADQKLHVGDATASLGTEEDVSYGLT